MCVYENIYITTSTARLYMTLLVQIGPPNLQILKSEDKSTWTAKDVADSVLSDKSALVLYFPNIHFTIMCWLIFSGLHGLHACSMITYDNLYPKSTILHWICLYSQIFCLIMLSSLINTRFFFLLLWVTKFYRPWVFVCPSAEGNFHSAISWKFNSWYTQIWSELVWVIWTFE